MTRTSALVFIIIALFAADVTGGVALVKLGGHISVQQDRLSANEAAQARNRVSNVRVWCQAINQGRDYDRRLVPALTGGHDRYGLPNLPCRRLEQQAILSAR